MHVIIMGNPNFLRTVNRDILATHTLCARHLPQSVRQRPLPANVLAITHAQAAAELARAANTHLGFNFQKSRGDCREFIPQGSKYNHNWDASFNLRRE